MSKIVILNDSNVNSSSWSEVANSAREFRSSLETFRANCASTPQARVINLALLSLEVLQSALRHAAVLPRVRDDAYSA
jgi:hypothetical protein